MGDSFNKIVAIILLAIGLFIYPALIMFENQDSIARTVVFSETARFIENSCNTAKITQNNLNVLMHNIGATNNIYEIKITHYRHLDFNNLESDMLNDDYIIVTNDIIFEDINTTSNYNMSMNDYLKIEVINKNKTIATKIQNMLYNGNMGAGKIYVQYGGVVKNEAQ